MPSIELQEVERCDVLVTLRAQIAPSDVPQRIAYQTRTGALLRAEGVPIGAFDREHHALTLPASAAARVLTLEVERHALPTNALPSGDGLKWLLLNALSHPEPARTLSIEAASGDGLPPLADGTLPVIGHSHLDVAWLWTFEETRRKAARTFAIAAELLSRDDTFEFIQSQPQLYAYVEEDEPQLFERVCEFVKQGRFSPEVAAMWVEPDCNIPSGESLLRQMLYANAYCNERFGITPSIAWLPDSFGFANTLPTLLRHAGISRFATTKLNWNDTTKFPYPQFRWRGPDGSEVSAALIASYDGGLDARRIAVARERNEPVVAGYGDGGGGVTEEMLADVRRKGRWIHPAAWFDDLDAQREKLPVHADELYLEYHRGVYTTNRAIKMHNALLERSLEHAEELVSWCIAVHAPRDTVDRFRDGLRGAWTIVLRNQFHDVLPGTSIAKAHNAAVDDYLNAEELVLSIITAAEQMLPRALIRPKQHQAPVPVLDGDLYRFENALVRAAVRPNGTIVELSGRDGRNVVTQANVLVTYGDRPKQWDAWNVDAGYRRSMRPARPQSASIEGNALIVPFLLDGRGHRASTATMRIVLEANEPFVRVDLDVAWHARHRLLRVESWLPIRAAHVRFGTPHGTIARSTAAQTPQERAKFEVPGQRFAFASDDASGLAQFAVDTYGWSARALPEGGVQLGHSLLRSATWPDPRADEGDHHLAWAFAPATGATVGALERTWRALAHEPRVRLFTTADDGVSVVAVKPAEDGDGVIVRVRECDGAARRVRLRSGARMSAAHAVDGIERSIGETPPAIEGESLVFDISAFALASFRVRF